MDDFKVVWCRRLECQIDIQACINRQKKQTKQSCCNCSQGKSLMVESAKGTKIILRRNKND